MFRGLKLTLIVLALGFAVLPSAHAATATENSLASDVFAKINQKRSEHGVPTLAFDGGLAAGAQAAAEFNRTHVGEPSCVDACHTANGPEHFEIVYWGVGTTAQADDAISTWMNSSQHRANMLSTGATAGGAGVAINPDTGRTWMIAWFNGGDSAPANQPPKTTTTRFRSTPDPAAPTTAAPAATTIPATTTVATDTTIDTSTTTSTTEPRATSTLLAGKSSDGGSNTGLLIAIVAVVLATAGAGSFVLVARRRSE